MTPMTRGPHARGTAEEHVDRGPETVLPRPARDAEVVVDDDKVVVRGRHDDAAGPQRLLLGRRGHRQPPVPAQDRREHAGARRGKVQDDEHRRRQVGIQTRDEPAQALHAAGRRADHDDVQAQGVAARRSRATRSGDGRAARTGFLNTTDGHGASWLLPTGAAA